MARQSRNTRQKGLLSGAVERMEGFFDAEEIYMQVKTKGISRATIYRYLLEAKEKGDLYAYTCQRRHVYAKGKKSHCHFECERTGKIIHFDIDNIDFLKDKIPGTITSFQIEVKGVCKRCEND